MGKNVSNPSTVAWLATIAEVHTFDDPERKPLLHETKQNKTKHMFRSWFLESPRLAGRRNPQKRANVLLFVVVLPWYLPSSNVYTALLREVPGIQYTEIHIQKMMTYVDL